MQRALLILLVAASYGLLAGARPWALAALLAIAIVAVLLAPRRTLTLASPSLDRALIAIMIAIALQIIPLPTAVVNVLSPNRARVASALNLAPLIGGDTGWHSISLDPISSAWSLATVALGVLAFWITRALCAACGRSPRSWRCCKRRSRRDW